MTRPISRRAALSTGVALPAAALATKVGASASVEEPPGTPIRLEGTPHLFLVSADYPQLHWVGDTRALAKYPAFWDRQKTWPYWVFHRWGGLWMGDPYLSAGLLKDGDPIYLVKWEQNWDKPRLFHIQSIADVELFGINARNYGKFVLDKPAWEAKYGFDAARLLRFPLQPATWGNWRAAETIDNPQPGITYYDSLTTPHGNGRGDILSFRCVPGSDQWQARIGPRAIQQGPRAFRNYTGPVKVRSPLFGTLIDATSRGVWGVEWTTGKDFVNALIAHLRNAETETILMVEYPGSDEALGVYLRPAGIETAAAWLTAECAQ